MLSMDADTRWMAVTRDEGWVVEAVSTRSREVVEGIAAMLFRSVVRALDVCCRPRHPHGT